MVLANPPYSIKQWDRAAWQSDKWGRNLYGTPPQGRADYAFWQHILCSMNRDSGDARSFSRMACFFGDEEQEMRAGWLQPTSSKP